MGLLAAAAPQSGAVDWLSLLKHPYAACRLATAECRSRARHMELMMWRTDKPEHSLWLDELKKNLESLTKAWGKARPLAAWLTDHLRLAEKIAASDGESGESPVAWRSRRCGYGMA